MRKLPDPHGSFPSRRISAFPGPDPAESRRGQARGRKLCPGSRETAWPLSINLETKESHHSLPGNEPGYSSPPVHPSNHSVPRVGAFPWLLTADPGGADRCPRPAPGFEPGGHWPSSIRIRVDDAQTLVVALHPPSLQRIPGAQRSVTIRQKQLTVSLK